MTQSAPVALITGAAQRIGAEIARTLHATGSDIAIHYHTSEVAAKRLKLQLEAKRPDSVLLIQADLAEEQAPVTLINRITAWRRRLDLLINNASGFYPTPLAEASREQWQELMASNLTAPFFLSQAAAPLLKKSGGSIINLVDIHAERPLKEFPIYSIAKAGNAMLVKSLAIELGPEIRVNGIAPGTILWPEQELAEDEKALILRRTSLKRIGNPTDIAKAVLFLVRDAGYITGQIISVDGGRTLQQ